MNNDFTYHIILKNGVHVSGKGNTQLSFDQVKRKEDERK